MKKYSTMPRKMLMLAGLAILMLIQSCTSSSDQNFPDPNNASEDSASVQFLVTGIEAGSRIDLGIYLRAVGSFGREILYFEPSDPRYTGELLIGPIDPGGFLLNRPWSARYQVIRDCNILLTRAEGANNPGAIRGFAQTMVAYQHLLNLIYTDANGIRVDVAGDTLGPFIGKTEALSFIAGALDDGFNALNSAGTSFGFQLSSGFAGFDTPATFAQFNRALRARVAAYQSDWATVLSALAGSFADPAGSMNLGVFHVYSGGSGDLLNPVFEDPASDTVKLHGHMSFAAEAEAGDSRYTSKITVASEIRRFDNLESDLRVTTSKSSTDPLAMIRNEELLLLSAEANIQQGNLSDAETYINVVRAAAGLAAVSLTDQAGAIDQMLHERRYSLFNEGHRWVDLRRYGRLNTLPLDRAGDVVIELMPIPTNENQ